MNHTSFLLHEIGELLGQVSSQFIPRYDARVVVHLLLPAHLPESWSSWVEQFQSDNARL